MYFSLKLFYFSLCLLCFICVMQLYLQICCKDRRIVFLYFNKFKAFMIQDLGIQCQTNEIFKNKIINQQVTHSQSVQCLIVLAVEILTIKASHKKLCKRYIREQYQDQQKTRTIPNEQKTILSSMKRSQYLKDIK